ncbi:hypothetical protein CH370_20040 [Leptospira kmetyi]|uniref:Uncharacterized protein n=1 Tax=Leptospira kmetyi TaxID=408139 RepID=A0ABX4N6Y8_9LEPT|nr:hypothetical protein CH378_14475 [Leptospira kmetyi]PJZ39745.1 hypothetical protein CH370_20040 [Leptospira kmetyi]
MTFNDRFQNYLKHEDFETTVSSIKFLEHFKYFKIPANQYFSSDRFSTKNGSIIPIEDISFDKVNGKLQLHLQPKFAYIIYSSNNRKVNLASMFSKIDIHNENKQITIQNEEMIKYFSYNSNCDCNLFIFK